MNRLIIKFVCFSLIGGIFFNADNLKALVPYYYLPQSKNLKKESLSIGNSAYQLLYFGQIKDSLNLAKLAVSINRNNEKLWSILAEAQMANNLDNEALISLNNAQKLNPKISDLYFAKSSIFLKQSKIRKAKIELQNGLEIAPNNHRAIFQLGNIFLMEKNFQKAIKEFEKAVLIKPDFWQAINNKGLAYFEIEKINLSIVNFKKAIAIKENGESLLALASSLKLQNYKESILLAKKALIKDPNYVEFNYRKEQLWGEKLQKSTEDLFKSPQLENEVILAKLKINETS